MKWGMLLYIGFIVGIVVMADLGRFPDIFLFYQRVPGADTMGHFVLMGLLALIVNETLGWRTWDWGRVRFWTGTSLVVLIVTVEEVSQHWLPRRSFSLTDLSADYLGIWFFSAAAQWWKRRSAPPPR